MGHLRGVQILFGGVDKVCSPIEVSGLGLRRLGTLTKLCRGNGYGILGTKIYIYGIRWCAKAGR